MKTRKELDYAAAQFTKMHNDRLGKPLGVHDGLLLYPFVPYWYQEGACCGPPQCIVVDVRTGNARYQTAEEIRTANIAPILRHLEPIPK